MSAEKVPFSHVVLVEIIAATTACTLLVAGITFYIVFRCAIAREHRENKSASSFRREDDVDHRNCIQGVRTLEKIVVDAHGKEVLYLQKVEGRQLRCFSTIWINPLDEEEKKEDKLQISQPAKDGHLEFTGSGLPPQQHSQPAAHISLSSFPERQTPSPSPPPPPPPPPPLPPIKKVSRPPPPPKIPAKRNTTEPPRQSPGALISPFKPPNTPRWNVHNTSKSEVLTEGSSTANGGVHTKMKALHWEKVNADVDHSLVWNEINDGSLR